MKERSKQGKQTNKAKKHSTPKAVTFPKKNELPRVGLEPMTLYTLDRVLYQLYMYTWTFDIASGSNKRLNRITSAGDVRYAGYSSGEKGRGSSSGEKDRPKRSRDDRGRGRSSAEGSRASSRSSQRGSGGGSSSGGGGGGRVKLSASGSSGGADGPRKVSCTCRQRKRGRDGGGQGGGVLVWQAEGWEKTGGGACFVVSSCLCNST